MSASKQGERAAIFDLDGTLYTGHITQAIAGNHRARKVKRLELLAYMVVHIPLWWLSRLKLASEERMRSIWAQNQSWLLRGWTPEQARTTFDWIAGEYVPARLRGEMMARLRAHQDADERIILVSGTFSPLLASIGQGLGISETVGTPLIVKRGRYTGGSQRPVCQGAHKVTRLEAHLAQTAPIDWGGSSAYADSYMDIPVLKRVGHPVAVHPDTRLRKYAASAGWEIVG